MKKLNEKNLIANNNIVDYVFLISMIFRKYLSSQMKFDASEMTSDEIDSMLKKIFTPIKYKKYGAEIISIFNLWDLSKFAEFTPSEEVLQQNYIDTVKIAAKISEDYRYARI